MNGYRFGRVVLIFAALGALVMGGLNTRPWVKAAGAYDNAAIADAALAYYSGNNSKRAPAAKACSDAKKPGDSGGQCRAFVNCIIWMVSGGKQSTGGSYFQGFIQAGGSEVGGVDNLRKGDIVQEGEGRHTSIVVSRVRENRFMVVDANHWGDQTVGYYERAIGLGGDIRAFRMGTSQPSNAPPFGSIDWIGTVPDGFRVAGWTIDPDTSASVQTHLYSGNGLPGANPGTAVWANLNRPDVERVHRKGSAHGYDVFVPASGDERQRICAYGINTPEGDNPATACREVARSNNTPYGAVNGAARTPEGVRIFGWTLDPDTTRPLDVHIYAGNGKPGGGPGWSVPAATERIDVGSVYPAYGSLHGFDVVLPIGNGPQQVCAYAINERPGHHPQIGCFQL